MKKTIFLVFFLVMTIFSVKAEDAKTVSALFENRSVRVLGGIEGKALNFISIGLDSTSSGIGDNLMIFFDKDYQIVNY